MYVNLFGELPENKAFPEYGLVLMRELARRANASV
jgi:hypothetical protein